jgi:hypothetical protein
MGIMRTSILIVFYVIILVIHVKENNKMIVFHVLLRIFLIEYLKIIFVSAKAVKNIEI